MLPLKPGVSLKTIILLEKGKHLPKPDTLGIISSLIAIAKRLKRCYNE